MGQIKDLWFEDKDKDLVPWSKDNDNDKDCRSSRTRTFIEDNNTGTRPNY